MVRYPILRMPVGTVVVVVAVVTAAVDDGDAAVVAYERSSAL